MEDTQSHTKQSKFAFIAITLITLAFGLISRGDFEANWIEFNPFTNSTWIGEHGYVSGDFENLTPLSTAPNLTRFDLDVTLQEQLGPKFRILMFIGNSCKDKPLIFGQWRTQLIVMQGCDFPNESEQSRLSTDITEYLGTSTKISVLLANSKNKIFIGNTLAIEQLGSIYQASSSEQSSKILIGNSPDGQYGWTGFLSSFSIKKQLEKNGTSSIIRNYQFSAPDKSGKIVDTSSATSSLNIPKIGRFLKPDRLAYASLDSLLEHQLFDVLINLIGFIPMGVVSAWLFHSLFGLRSWRLLLSTVITACIVSLTIELSQAYIAGRRSHLHDLILNCLSSIVGYFAFSSISLLMRWRSNKDSSPDNEKFKNG